MDQELKAFLQGQTPLAEEWVVWPLDGDDFVQTRFTYAADSAPPRRFVTSVRAVVTWGREILVARDPESEHILPGGRINNDEGVLEALQRELLEESGWAVHNPPTLIGLFHYYIHSFKPDGYRYPYPDYLQLIYRAEARRYIPAAIEADGYELGAEFRPLADVRRMPFSLGEIALLQILYA